MCLPVYLIYFSCHNLLYIQKPFFFLTSCFYSFILFFFSRHHCIHRQKTERPSGPCALTEYKETFKKFDNYQPARPIRPDAATKLSGVPLDGKTLYEQEYKQHALEPRKKREQAKYIKPSGAFDGASSYQYDYTEKSADKMPSARPAYQPATSDRPFSGTTVHKETYKPWDIPMMTGIRHPPAIRMPSGTFDHRTTFQNDFTGHPGVSGRQPIIPKEPTLSVGHGKFSDETTTRRDYTPKDARPEKSAKPPQYILHHSDPFDHKTTFQHNFPWPTGRPADSCKPMEMTRRSSLPLDSLTTHNMTYKPWEIARREGWKPKSGWVPPGDPFDCKTTFQHDYSGKEAAPAKSARPTYYRVEPGDFNDMTTHKDAFKPWEANARQSCKPKQDYSPQGKFDGATTFQTDYKGHSGDRRGPCIPKGSKLGFQGPHDFSTMYRDTFLGERPPSCPAKYLEMRRNISSRNGYVFKVDNNGHQFFKPPYVRESLERIAPVSPQHHQLSKSIEVLAI